MTQVQGEGYESILRSRQWTESWVELKAEIIVRGTVKIDIPSRRDSKSRAER